ncbi:Riboflavin synthase [Buchnera aphidicola (Pterocallis alni)]|uniref:riboflavin synthase subunit alpha n=1 Tax=Buchnera aphidicola TaxID=9 RepID=UPI0034638939
MFTGIIQGCAKVLEIKKRNKLYIYKFKFPKNLSYNIKLGDSISNNGCCLSVTEIDKNNISFDVMEETLLVTNLSFLSIGSIVNIERSLKFGDELGGHLLSGHIMNTAKIYNIIDVGDSKKIYFEIKDLQMMKYIFLKGFIGIDGISLTVNSIKDNTFSICLIPETIFNTNMFSRMIGDLVNIEVDYYTQIIIDKLDQYLKQKNIVGL